MLNIRKTIFITSFFVGALQMHASVADLDEILGAISTIDRAWVSDIGKDSSAAPAIKAYDKCFDGTTSMTPYNLATVSRRGRVALFKHILNRNIAKVREGLKDDAVLLPGANNDLRITADPLSTYFKRLVNTKFPGTYSGTYYGRKTAEFTYGGLKFKLNPNPTAEQHGNSYLHQVDFKESTEYSVLFKAAVDAGLGEKLLIKCIADGKDDAHVIRSSDDKKIQDKKNVCFFLDYSLNSKLPDAMLITHPQRKIPRTTI